MRSWSAPTQHKLRKLEHSRSTATQSPSAAKKKNFFFNVSVYAKAIEPPDVDLGLQLVASKLRKLTSQGIKLTKRDCMSLHFDL